MPTGFVERVKGKSAIANQYQQQNTAFFTSAIDNITATPSGTQGNSIMLTNTQTRITTAASGSSVLLPAAQPGASVVICNDGAFTLGVWPSGIDKINAGSAGAKDTTVCTAASVSIFYCFSAGQWRTK